MTQKAPCYKLCLTKLISRYVQVKIWLPGLLIGVGLACATNTPVAQVSTPRATRTPIPTFTNPPVPPTPTITPTFTPTPLVTNTPASTNTPIPTHTPVPTETPTETPVPPTNTPPPPPTAVPPTNSPVPTATPVPAPVSPLAPPTFTPVPGSPAGTYESTEEEGEANCAHVGVYGKVRDGEDDDDALMPNVTVKVTGNKDPYGGHFYATTNSDSEYVLVIGELKDVGDVKFKAEIFGNGVDTQGEPEWETDKDCHKNNAVQVMKINWGKKR